ncbi:hypothetical protein COHA_007760 [Chlorella ohadii]|uniref:G-patch domain-containing protein n=1 Tax=Chlorella ohadii TaxID=2649997 RepID=A0AAD5DLC2_9CHLO|nr:hypothetical protein COHA_007760 [Chlorella ohadii]
MAESDGEEDFHFWGTPVEDEVEMRAGQHRKEVRDAASTRALPLHKQEVTDAEGRRRLHGAFTGGWSAGYYNTVGSKEGWQPGEFRSSRGARAAVQQSVEQFLDEDELEELRKTNLQTTQEYDTFGSTAAEMARRAAAEAAAERPSGKQTVKLEEAVRMLEASIPGLVPDEVVAPVADSVGIRLLQKMGWRQGKGIGTGDAAQQQEEGGGEGGRPRRRWGQHAAVAPENTQLYLLAPKTDVHGLGFDPFKGAEDFRRLKEQAREAARPKTTAEARKRRRGIAFGSGVLDDEDGYGEGATMEDYVTHDEVEDYDETVQDDGLPRSRGPRVQRSGLGDRLAAKGYSFEIMDEEEEEPQRLLGWSGQEQQRQYALPGRAEPLMLQSREQQVKNSLIPGFVLATRTITFAYFPPPHLPPGYVPLHRTAQPAEAAAPAAAARFAPPQADPPADPELRQAIDSLAFFVAKNGVIFENMARQKQQKEGRWSFLSGGLGADYYRWKVHSLKSIIQPQQQRAPPRAIGQRSAPLSADERGALLGEQQLPATQQGWAATGGIGKVVTEADLARQVDASAQPAAGGGLSLHPAGGTGQQQGAAAAKRLPVRRVEEWRPAALLCKRFNVADPYQGRPAELQMSRFKTDHLALPDTAAAVAATLNAVPAGAQDFLLPPTVAAALAEAEAKQLQQQAGQPAAAPQGQLLSAQAVAMTAQQAQQAQQAPQDAAGAADAFLSSLSDMLGGGGEAAMAAGAAPPPLLPEQQPEAEAAVPTAAVEAERPMDLFKAIFEDSDEELEEEQPPEQQPQPAAQQSEQQQQQAAAAGQPPLPLGPPPPQQQPEEAAFGFAKLRQPAPPPLPPGPPPPLPAGQAPLEPGLGAGAPAAASAGAGIDDALKQRVQDALRALKKDKKEKRGSNKRKKEKKEKRGKEKSRKHKKDSKERRRKEERRRRSGGSSSDSRSSGSSDSD